MVDLTSGGENYERAEANIRRQKRALEKALKGSQGKLPGDKISVNFPKDFGGETKMLRGDVLKQTRNLTREGGTFTETAVRGVKGGQRGEMELVDTLKVKGRTPVQDRPYTGTLVEGAPSRAQTVSPAQTPPPTTAQPSAPRVAKPAGTAPSTTQAPPQMSPRHQMSMSQSAYEQQLERSKQARDWARTNRARNPQPTAQPAPPKDPGLLKREEAYLEKLKAEKKAGGSVGDAAKKKQTWGEWFDEKLGRNKGGAAEGKAKIQSNLQKAGIDVKKPTSRPLAELVKAEQIANRKPFLSRLVGGAKEGLVNGAKWVGKTAKIIRRHPKMALKIAKGALKLSTKTVIKGLLVTAVVIPSMMLSTHCYGEYVSGTSGVNEGACHFFYGDTNWGSDKGMLGVAWEGTLNMVWNGIDSIGINKALDYVFGADVQDEDEEALSFDQRTDGGTPPDEGAPGVFDIPKDEVKLSGPDTAKVALTADQVCGSTCFISQTFGGISSDCSVETCIKKQCALLAEKDRKPWCKELLNEMCGEKAATKQDYCPKKEEEEAADFKYASIKVGSKGVLATLGEEKEVFGKYCEKFKEHNSQSDVWKLIEKELVSISMVISGDIPPLRKGENGKDLSAQTALCLKSDGRCQALRWKFDLKNREGKEVTSEGVAIYPKIELIGERRKVEYTLDSLLGTAKSSGEGEEEDSSEIKGRAVSGQGFDPTQVRARVVGLSNGAIIMIANNVQYNDFENGKPVTKTANVGLVSTLPQTVNHELNYEYVQKAAKGECSFFGVTLNLDDDLKPFISGKIIDERTRLDKERKRLEGELVRLNKACKKGGIANCDPEVYNTIKEEIQNYKYDFTKWEGDKGLLEELVEFWKKRNWGPLPGDIQSSLDAGSRADSGFQTADSLEGKDGEGASGGGGAGGGAAGGEAEKKPGTEEKPAGTEEAGEKGPLTAAVERVLRPATNLASRAMEGARSLVNAFLPSSMEIGPGSQGQLAIQPTGISPGGLGTGGASGPSQGADDETPQGGGSGGGGSGPGGVGLRMCETSEESTDDLLPLTGSATEEIPQQPDVDGGPVPAPELENIFQQPDEQPATGGEIKEKVPKTIECCGNEICAGAENNDNCPGDCGVPNEDCEKEGYLSTEDFIAQCIDPCIEDEKWICEPNGGKPKGCGDGTCVEGENIACPEDCVVASCGDSICATDETTEDCPKDCPAAGDGDYCGDEICSATETLTSCSTDCADKTPFGSDATNIASALEGIEDAISYKQEQAAREPVSPAVPVIGVGLAGLGGLAYVLLNALRKTQAEEAAA
ncbi:hypothetical protein ACFLZZ_03560 [Nanoarchaeota archaeon]